MFGTFLSGLNFAGLNDSVQSQRHHQRRACDPCISVVNGRAYPVENWSQGGLLLQGDGKMLGVGEDVTVTLKFRLRNTILNLDHTGKVVRKQGEKVAIRFMPLTERIRRGFQQVIDDYLTREFAESQMA